MQFLDKVLPQRFIPQRNDCKFILHMLINHLLSRDEGWQEKKTLDLTTVRLNTSTKQLNFTYAKYSPNPLRSIYDQLLIDFASFVPHSGGTTRENWMEFISRVKGDPKKAFEDRFFAPICTEKGYEMMADPNKYIAAKLKLVAKLRDQQGEKRSATAYDKAARAVSLHPKPINTYADAIAIKFVGKSAAEKIDEILDTTTLEILEERSDLDSALEVFTGIWGVGSETAKSWYELGYRTIEDVRIALKSEKLTMTKTQVICLDAYEDLKVEMQRSEMEDIHQLVVKAMDVLPELRSEIVGSYRRGKQSSKDVDILVYPKENTVCNRPYMQRICRTISEELGKMCKVDVLALGMRKLECIVHTKLGKRRLDVFTSTLDGLGCALIAHTGSAQFNVLLRHEAKQRGWMLNEIHLYDEEGDVIITPDEKTVFDKFGMEYKEPKDRK